MYPMCKEYILELVTDPGFPGRAGGDSLLFGQNFPENCMKMKEIWPKGASLAPLDPPMLILWLQIIIRFRESLTW